MSNPHVVGIGPQVKMAIGTVPLNRAAGAVSGSAIDRTGFNSLVLEALCGVTEGTPDSFTVTAKLQHSDTTTDGDFSDVTGGGVTALTAASTRKRKTVNLKPLKKYVRAVSTVAFVGGTTPKVNTATVVVLGSPVVEPAQADD